MSDDLATAMKNSGVIFFIELVGGGRIGSGFSPNNHSHQITVTLDSHVMTKYLSIVPCAEEPGMKLTITDTPYTLTETTVPVETPVSTETPTPPITMKLGKK